MLGTSEAFWLVAANISPNDVELDSLEEGKFICWAQTWGHQIEHRTSI